MSFWGGKRVFITGSSGLIGGYLCRALHDEGARITGYDLTAIGTLPWHGLTAAFPVVNGDILNTDMLTHFIKGQDVVFHLAANSGVEESRAAGKRAFTLNVNGTMNVLEAARHAGKQLKAVMVSSSNHVYGPQQHYPVREDAPLNQLDAYSVSKIMADYLARGYAHNYGVPTVVVRNTNCYGPYDPHYKHIIPATILSLMGNRRPTINGNGTTKKAYLYTTDVVTGMMAAAEWTVESGVKGEAFNFTDEAISVEELVSMITSFMGSRIATVPDDKPNDQVSEDLSWQKANKVLGWEPKVPLEEGLKATITWFRERELNGNGSDSGESG